MSHPIRTAALLVLGVLLSGQARAQERYYLVMFGSQRPVINNPKYTHTFAVFAKVTGEDCGGSGPLLLQSVTISWLPTDGAVQLRRLLPQPGRNWGLDETIRQVQSEKQRVSYWGPYEIEKQLYCRALAQRAHLESGEVKYKAVDTAFPSERVSNCIHAVGDISGESFRVRVLSPSWGDVASYFVLLQLRPWIVEPGRTHDWLLPALGLDRYCLTRREMEDRNPKSGPVRRTLQEFRFPGLGR